MQFPVSRYLCGFFLSTAGSAMCPIALSFGLIHAGKGAGAIGVVLFATIAPAVLLAPVAGAAADRLGRRRVMISADLARGAAELVFVSALWSGHMPATFAFVLLATILGLGQAFFFPASAGFLRMIAGDRLRQAIAWQASLRALARIGGPAIAGLLVQAGSTDLVLLVDGLGFVANAILLLTTATNVVQSSPTQRLGHSALREAFSVTSRSRWLAGVFAFEGFFHMCVYAPCMALGPVIAARFGNGSTAWGLISSLEGVGAILGGVAISRIKFTQPLRAAFAFAALAAIMPLALATEDWLPPIMAAAFVGGIGLVSYDVLKDTFVQGRVDASVVSSIAAFDIFVNSAAVALGYLAAPAIAALAGAEATLAAAAFLCVPLSLALTRVRPRVVSQA